jgi:hypothetical protein
VAVSQRPLYQPITVGTMRLDHRLVVPPHSGGGGALLGSEDQFERMRRYWLARVEGGMQWVGGGPVFVRNPPIPVVLRHPSGVGARPDGARLTRRCSVEVEHPQSDLVQGFPQGPR